MRAVLGFVLAASVSLALAQGAESPPQPADAVEPVLAGKATLVEGDVRIYDAANRARTPKVADPVYKGERIATGADGEMHLDLEDGGYIGVRPNTSMRIDDFKADGGPDDRFVVNLIQGSFRSITGWIARLNRQNYTVRTSTATIGVRGTEHEPLVIPEGSSEGEPGTYDWVHTGETEIRTQQGTVGVRANQAGFAPHRGAARPRVLERVPGFFRPTRNEGRFQGLHERLHQRLEQRLQARRQVVEQRRKALQERRAVKKSAVEHRKEQRLEHREEHVQQQQKQHKLQEQRAEKQQKLIEERKQQAEKARQEREKKRREAAKKEHERAAAKKERGE